MCQSSSKFHPVKEMLEQHFFLLNLSTSYLSEEEEPRLDDSLETQDLMELVRAQERAEKEADKGSKVSVLQLFTVLLP